MTSLEYLRNRFVSSCLDHSIDPSLYENNNIEEKPEVHELLRLHPEKKEKIIRVSNYCFYGNKNESIIGFIFRKFRRRCEILYYQSMRRDDTSANCWIQTQNSKIF